MSRSAPIQNSFVAGELSPRLEARGDLEQYHQGLRQCENGIVMPHGGFRRRPGTKYVLPAKDSTKATRLIPFVPSLTAAYVIVAGDLNFRFCTDSAVVVLPAAFADEGTFADGASFADANTPVEIATPYAHTSLFDLQWAQQADMLYLAHPAVPVNILTRVSATEFTIAEIAWRDGFAPLLKPNVSTTTITKSGGGPYTLTASAALWDHDGGTDVGRTVRVKDTTEGWYKITGTSSTTVVTATLENSTAAGTGPTTDWSLGMFSDTDGARAVVFHENRLWLFGCPRDGERLAGSDSGTYDRYSNDPTADDNAIYIQVATSGKVQTGQWLASTDEALWAGTFSGEGVVVPVDDSILTPTSARFKARTKRGAIHTMPVLVDSDVMFVQRNARKIRSPRLQVTSDRFSSSEVSILAEHILRSGVTEMDHQQDPDSVVWAPRADGQLVGFTIEPEQRVVAGHRQVFAGVSDTSGTHALCKSIAVIPNSAGSEDQLWVAVQRRINGADVCYVEVAQPYFNPGLSPGATQLERINAMDGIWFLDAALEFDAPISITGITAADPPVVTAAAHGLSDGDEVLIRDVVGMTEVNRRHYTVASATANTFALQTTANPPADVEGAAYTAYVTGGTARKLFTTVTGLDHLEGLTVQIVADAATHPDAVVSDGVVTLARKAARVLVGLHITPKLETQRFGHQGWLSRTPRLAARMMDTAEGVRFGVGPDPDQFVSPRFRDGDWPMDAPPALYSGDREMALEGDWTRTPTVYVDQPYPMPMTILGLMPSMGTGEK